MKDNPWGLFEKRLKFSQCELADAAPIGTIAFMHSLLTTRVAQKLTLLASKCMKPPIFKQTY